ncbi:MAG: RagB/SusD family nutrient uptake outer membrane protein [Bacteroidales bacterium]|nr:RagB/SusD family nutrient uptake outer membrane protein [Candidatus Cryptobacteroides choladohippi]
MKKILVFAIALTALSLSSCKSFLDVKPEGTPTADTYFTNDAQAENAIKAIYGPFYDGDDAYGREIYWEQCAGNMMVPGRTRGYSGLFTLNYDGDFDPLKNVWNCFTKLSARANWIIDALLEKQKVTPLTEVESRSLGEAYFMRAFFHFTLAYRYGCGTQGIPAVKWEQVREETGSVYNYQIPPQQATVMDNYKMIIEDFDAALPLIKSVNDYDKDNVGRACKEAAVAMKARVYSYWATWDKSKWSDVKACVDELETTYKRDLLPSYSEIFSEEFTNWFGPEYCFSIPSTGGVGAVRAGVEFTGACLENKGWGVYNGWGQFKPTLDAYEELAKDNIKGERNERLTRSILEYGDEFVFPTASDLKEVKTWRFYSESDVETGFQINKYMPAFAHADFINAGYVNESGGGWPTTRTNFTIIRFADCLLLRAEANLHLGNADAAKADINRVRERSHLEPVTKVSWENIYHERYAELAFEPVCDHLGDLKRWAVSGEPEIKAIAIKELESHPRARHYSGTLPDGTFKEGYRGDPDGTWEPGPYLDFQSPAPVWADYKICFPYPSDEITKAAGALKQNPGY